MSDQVTLDEIVRQYEVCLLAYRRFYECYYLKDQRLKRNKVVALVARKNLEREEHLFGQMLLNTHLPSGGFSGRIW